jgi:multicomponent Na+:H+ antiporter subunit E
MSSFTAPRQSSPVPILARRSLGFFALWCALIGLAPKDMTVGLVAVAAATWVSARLWPSGSRLSMMGLVRFAPRSLAQSVIAGLDVARRALAPRVALNPGLVSHRATLESGFAQGALCAVMSLQPGKLPVSCEASGDMLVHCLDMEAPVADELAADEAAFLGMWRGARDG